MQRLCNCTILEHLHEGVTTTLYRAWREVDQRHVVLKVLTPIRASPTALASLRHEHEMLCRFNVENDGVDQLQGVIRTFGVEEDQGHHVLVLEDFGAKAIKDLKLAGRMLVQDFLALAIQLVDIVEQIHQHHIVHKDINPSNLVLNQQRGRVKAIDFGIATLLAEETTEFGGASVLEGTLAYMSPEQTGRMNRALDYRSDYYSLGVTLFELLTGRCPFQSDDPLEVVHWHVARPAPSPQAFDASVPDMIAEIVLKLLAKNADDRYQSAKGIREDLRQCLDQRVHGGRVSRFELAQQDGSERFRLPQKLYGRDKEVEQILAAFERASHGAASLMMVSGYSGVGKSALVQELYRPITSQRGYFLSGKFDQYQTHVPYSALTQAFQSLAKQLLTESPERLAIWKQQILDATSSNASVLKGICPGLEQILGDQPEAPALSPAESRVRLQFVVREFMTVLAKPEHPLCLFLDDLQWADADSLKLFEHLMSSAQGLSMLVIGAYRDNEVNEAHPLTMTLEALKQQGVDVESLVVLPLGLQDLEAMLEDTLSVPMKPVAPLAELLLSRTGGNPFFLRAFLTLMHKNQLVKRFSAGWYWSLKEVAQEGVTDNVASLMMHRLRGLPEPTQEILRFAACLGGTFDLGTLDIVAGCTAGSGGRDLWDAVQEGLVIPLDKVLSQTEMATAGLAIRMRFAHDRIQQAVISMIEPEKRPQLNRHVGLRLLQGTSGEEQERWLFVIVGHLNQGTTAVTDRDELSRLARLNLLAAKKAQKAAASRQALSFAQSSISLLEDDAWGVQYAFTLEVYRIAVEAAFLASEFEAMRALSEVVIKHAHSPMDEVAVRRFEGLVHYGNQRPMQAIQAYLAALERLGFGVATDPTPQQIEEEMRATVELLGIRTPEQLLSLPRCSDRAAEAAMEILNNIIETATNANSPLMPISACQLVQLSLQHGNTPNSAVGYVCLGVLLSSFGDAERAHNFGRLSLDLANHFDDRGLRSQIYIFAYVLAMHWKAPLYEISKRFADAYAYGVQAANPVYAGNSLATLGITRFLAGHNLRALVIDMRHYSEEITKFRQTLFLDYLSVYQQATSNLCQDTEDPCRLVGEAYNEHRIVPIHRAANNAAGLFNYYFCKTFLCYLFGEFECANESALANAAYSFYSNSSMWAAPWAFLESLVQLSVYDSKPAEEQATILKTVDGNLEKLASWIPLCPVNYEHKYHLIKAERARVLGQHEEAQRAYAKGVELAKASGYVHEEALAYEVAGRFYLNQGQLDLGQQNLRDAQKAYMRWGAITKAKHLERQYFNILPKLTRGMGAATLSVATAERLGCNVLDLFSVINASHAISQEANLNALLVRLMQLVLETSGAEAGYLLLNKDGQWVVEAQNHVGFDVPEVRHSIPMDQLASMGHRELASSVVHYVSRTQETVMLDDATTSAHFGRDPYVAKHGIKSILCLPLVRQTHLVGILYLENSLIEKAFTPSRSHIVQLLSTQAAISLDNALLYETLEEKVKTRTHELEIKNKELEATLRKLKESQEKMVVYDRLASLGSLALGIAHELRAPLHFVANFAELGSGLVKDAIFQLDMLEDAEYELDTTAAEGFKDTLADVDINLKRVVEHGKRADNIIHTLLEHSTGAEAEKQEASLNALVQLYVRMALHGIKAREPSFNPVVEMDLDESIGKVSLVVQPISRVVVNLVTNACHAVKTKRVNLRGREEYVPKIQIKTRDRGSSIEIRVHDNGIGIKKDVRDKVFNPFFTTKQLGEATGLGLSICQDIVVGGHGGTLEFESEENKFTEFVVTLPK